MAGKDTVHLKRIEIPFTLPKRKTVTKNVFFINKKSVQNNTDVFGCCKYVADMFPLYNNR